MKRSYVNFIVLLITYRGETFRSVTTYVSDKVRFLVLTATATAKPRKRVLDVHGIQKPHLIYISPCRANIVLSVEMFQDITSTFTPLLEKFLLNRVSLPRVIIYCCTYQEYSSLYEFFVKGMKSKLTEPVDAPNIAQNRLVDIVVALTR